MDTNINKKVSVLNPLSLRNTVGAELADVFELYGIDNYEELIGVPNLRLKEHLSLKIINKTSEILDNAQIVEFLTSFQEDYLMEKSRYLSNYKKAKKSFSKLRKALHFLRDEFTNGYDLLEDIFDFFNVDNENQIYESSEKYFTSFKDHNNVDIDPVYLYAWLRRGELDYIKLELTSYNENDLIEWIESDEWLLHNNDKRYLRSLPKLISDFGVGIVFVPSTILTKTVYGVIRFIDERPLIQISDKHRCSSSCWNVVINELSNVIRHKDIENHWLSKTQSVSTYQIRNTNRVYPTANIECNTKFVLGESENVH